MPDHIKKTLNRAYLEDKPYNDIVLHLEREIRLNGQGAPDETTLVPLNTVDAVVTEDKKEQQQRGYCFYCEKYGLYKAQCHRLRKERYYATKASSAESKRTEAPKPKCGNCGKLHITKNCWDGANAANDPRKKNANSPSQPTKSTNNPYPPRPLSQKTEIAAPTIWGKSRREGVHNRGPPKQVRRRFFNRMQRRTDAGLATTMECRNDPQT